VGRGAVRCRRPRVLGRPGPQELARPGRRGHRGRRDLRQSRQAGWPRLTERFDLAKRSSAKVRGYAWGGGFGTGAGLRHRHRLNGRFVRPAEAKLGLMAGAGGVFQADPSAAGGRPPWATLTVPPDGRAPRYDLGW